MVERMAEAIRRENETMSGATFTELTEAMAVAAMKAMREPSDGMVEPAEQWLNGDEQEFHNNGDGSGYWVPRSVSVWERMIDAAIAEAERT